MFFPFWTKAQLITSTAMTPPQLVQNILLGQGVTVSNIVYNGHANAIGFFKGNTNLGLDSGIVMTTGTVLSPNGPIGPNNLGTSGIDNGMGGDIDLQTISGVNTFNAAVLEFDFIPSSDTVRFRYVFGSEEYNEYVCGTKNDAFAFIISGISVPLAATNIALIPGTTTQVSINTLNNGKIGVNGGGAVNCNLNNSAYFFDNETPPGATIQYDGFTKVLTAMSPVICGEKYHLKIAIADGGDGLYDSGVFLEANSLTSKSDFNVKKNIQFGLNDSTMAENCGTSTVTFERTTTDVTKADTVFYKIGGTAINGVDYVHIDTFVVFPPNVSKTSLQIKPVIDVLNEGTETIILTLRKSGPCNSNAPLVLKIYLQDLPPIKVKANNDMTYYCPNQKVLLNATAIGGLGYYKFEWKQLNGTSVISTKDTVTVEIDSTISYVVTATDSCALDRPMDTVTINLLYPALTASVTPNYTVCPGDTAFLAVQAFGGRPAYSYSWDNGVSGNSQAVMPAVSTNYTVTVKDSCNNTIQKVISVIVTKVVADFTYEFTSYSDVRFTNNSYTSPPPSKLQKYLWDFGDTAKASTVKNPFHTYDKEGTYKVTLIVTNSEGCMDTTEQQLVVHPALSFYYPNAFSPNGDILNDYYGGYGNGIVTYEMYIFDRWGQLIFKSTDINQMWDGKVKGEIVTEDVYIAKFRVTGFLNDAIESTTEVTIVR